jgi:hypothetical protein
MTKPQDEQKDNQDIFDLNMEQIVQLLLAPVDATRSQTAGDGFVESRVNAFYRMIGFPVVNGGLQYFSPGYDPTLNTDSIASAEHDSIIKSVVNNKQFVIKQLDAREAVPINFSRYFSVGGFNAKAIALGSLFIRSFENQFGSTGPLEFDKSQSQLVGQRISNLYSYYNASQEVFKSAAKSLNIFESNHPLKPFVVDPRIVVYPDTNIIAAPFLIDFSQLTCFGHTSYKRPFIENVINIRLNNKSTVKSSININQIIEDIKNDNNVVDKFLLAVKNNPQKGLQNSDISVFNNYFKLIRVLVDKLIDSTKIVADARNHMNFQPIPDPKFGLEGDLTVEAVERDLNNKEIETNILDTYAKGSLNSFAQASNLGAQGKVDPGNFAFSGLDDMVFSSDKSVGISAQEHLEDLTNKRKAIAKPALEALKNIEYIMGEFSGLGLIDIVAIQSALWLMDRDKLVGLIDANAYARLAKHRADLNLSGISRSDDVLESLKEFEKKLKNVYSLIQLYFNQVYNGQEFTSP